MRVSDYAKGVLIFPLLLSCALLRPAAVTVRRNADGTETRQVRRGYLEPAADVQKRLFVYDIGDGPDVLVNPVIDESRGEWTFEEGCLSVPELSWPIVRPKEVHLTGFDLDGNEVSLEADELLARLFQHELDHLDGVLLLQHLEPDQQKEARRILRQRALGLPVDPPPSERAGAL